jgi:hypothetical protein
LKKSEFFSSPDGKPRINLPNLRLHLDLGLHIVTRLGVKVGQFKKSLKCWFGQSHARNAVILKILV